MRAVSHFWREAPRASAACSRGWSDRVRRGPLPGRGGNAPSPAGRDGPGRHLQREERDWPVELEGHVSAMFATSAHSSPSVEIEVVRHQAHVLDHPDDGTSDTSIAEHRCLGLDVRGGMWPVAGGRRHVVRECMQPELSDHEALSLQGRPLRHSTFAESTKS